MKKQKFVVGGNFADGSRFEAGDEVPNTISKKELSVLEGMGAIEKGETQKIKPASVKSEGKVLAPAISEIKVNDAEAK